METALGKLHQVLLALQPMNRLILKNMLHFYTVLPRLLVFKMTLSFLQKILIKLTIVKRATLTFL